MLFPPIRLQLKTIRPVPCYARESFIRKTKKKIKISNANANAVRCLVSVKIWDGRMEVV